MNIYKILNKILKIYYKNNYKLNLLMNINYILNLKYHNNKKYQIYLK